MPTWKKKSKTGELQFRHLCDRCNERLDDVLMEEGWIFLRDGEPVSCNVCALVCRLTSQGLWGAEDAVRYEVCAACPDYAACPLKGRYFC